MTTRIISLILLLTLSLSMLHAQAQKQKVILDFDIGDDFDDANALGLLLASPEVELIGVVVDYGNTPKRASLACRMLYECGREDIPVVIGRQTYDKRTLNHVYSNQFLWGEGFDKVKPIKQGGADFIIEKLRKYPNEINLITIGPVTNMGDIMDKDPGALKLAKRVYAMFGSFYMGYCIGTVPVAEWNAEVDPEASKKYAASGANIIYAGLDVTTYVRLKQDIIDLLNYRNSPLTNAVLGLMSLSNFERKTKEPIIYDAVTIGLFLWPELFKSRKAFVKVNDEGYTLLDETKKPNCEIATSIQVDEFLTKYTERMLKQNLMRKD